MRNILVIAVGLLLASLSEGQDARLIFGQVRLQRSTLRMGLVPSSDCQNEPCIDPPKSPKTQTEDAWVVEQQCIVISPDAKFRTERSTRTKGGQVTGTVYEGELDRKLLEQLIAIIGSPQFRSLRSKQIPDTIIEGPPTAPTSVIGQEFHGPTPTQTRLTIEVKRESGLQSISHAAVIGDKDGPQGTQQLLRWWDEASRFSQSRLIKQLVPNGCQSTE